MLQKFGDLANYPNITKFSVKLIKLRRSLFSTDFIKINDKILRKKREQITFRIKKNLLYLKSNRVKIIFDFLTIER